MITRRTFVQSISTMAIVRQGSSVARAEHSGPNERGIQIGVPGSDSSAFKNFVSSLSSFQASGGTYPYPAVLNADQYPVGTIGATIFGRVPLPSNLKDADTMVFAWIGTATNTRGAIQLSRGAPGFVVTAGSNFVIGSTQFNLTMSGMNGYVEFKFNSPAPNAIALNFLNNSTFAGMSKIIFCRRTDYESIVSARSAEELISPAYVSAFKNLAPKVIRTMGYTDPNDGNNFTQHKYRPNWKTALTYSSAQWIPNCWAGTASGINSYTCHAAPDTPKMYSMGEVLQLQFLNASTATPLTINVGSRGDVPLFDMGGSSLKPGAIRANALATLIYDDLLEGYLTSFNGLAGNVPVEVQIGLANAVGTNLWYNFPPHIALSSVTEIAALIGKTLKKGCYFEYANEVWNFGYGFPQTGWAANCGTILGFPRDNNRQFYGFYALRVAEIMPMVTSAWGARDGLKCVMAFQAYGPGGLRGATNLYRLQGADLSRSLGYRKYNSYVNADYNSSPNRPVDVCDVLSYATYYSGAQCANFDPNYANVGGTGLNTGGPFGSGLLGAADAYAAGDAAGIANAFTFLDWDIRQGTNNGKLGGQTLLALKSGANNGSGIYSVWEAVAKSYDGAARPQGKADLTVECYEGAMECSAPSKPRCTALGIDVSYGGFGGMIDNLLKGYKNSRNFSATVQQQFRDFFANEHSKTASWFLIAGGSQWAMYPGDVYTNPYRSYEAVRDFRG